MTVQDCDCSDLGGYEWLTVEKTLMLDDLNNLPDFEQLQLIHVHPYRWTSIASNGLLSSKELEAVAEQDEEFAGVIEVMLAAATAFPSQTFSHGCCS